MAEYWSVGCMCHTFFIHSSVDGHLGGLHVLAAVNSTAVSIGVHVSFKTIVFSRYMCRSGVAESYIMFIFNLNRSKILKSIELKYMWGWMDSLFERVTRRAGEIALQLGTTRRFSPELVWCWDCTTPPRPGTGLLLLPRCCLGLTDTVPSSKGAQTCSVCFICKYLPYRNPWERTFLYSLEK